MKFMNNLIPKKMTIKEVLMTRDHMTSKEADKLITEARNDFWQRLEDGEMPDDICEEYFGLEPDYLEEFL